MRHVYVGLFTAGILILTLLIIGLAMFALALLAGLFGTTLVAGASIAVLIVAIGAAVIDWITEERT